MVKEGVWGEREYRVSRARACWEGWQAHSVCGGSAIPAAGQGLRLLVWRGAGIPPGCDVIWCVFRWSSLVASLDHRLQAGIPTGCEGSGACWERREYIASRARACWEGWQAHSVREGEL